MARSGAARLPGVTARSGCAGKCLPGSPADRPRAARKANGARSVARYRYVARPVTWPTPHSGEGRASNTIPDRIWTESRASTEAAPVAAVYDRRQNAADSRGISAVIDRRYRSLSDGAGCLATKSRALSKLLSQARQTPSSDRGSSRIPGRRAGGRCARSCRR